MKYLFLLLALFSSTVLALPKERPLEICHREGMGLNANGFVPAVTIGRTVPGGYDPVTKQPMKMIVMQGIFGWRVPYNTDGTDRLRHLYDNVVTARGPSGAATRVAHPFGLETRIVMGGLSESVLTETEGRRFYATGYKGAVASNIPGFYYWSKRYGNEVYFAVGTVMGNKLIAGRTYTWFGEIEHTPLINDAGFWRQVDNRSPMHMEVVLTKRLNVESEAVCPNGGCVAQCAGGSFDIVPRNFGIVAPACFMGTFQESELDRESIYRRYQTIIQPPRQNDMSESHLSLNQGWPSVSRCMLTIPGRNPNVVEK